jgi:hypothetical protein
MEMDLITVNSVMKYTLDKIFKSFNLQKRGEEKKVI